MVIFLSNSFLNRTVCTPDIAFTTVDFPCATCPIVPMFMVACRAMISGVSGVSEARSRSLGSGCSGSTGLLGSAMAPGARFKIDFGCFSVAASGFSCWSSSISTSSGFGVPGSDSSSEKSPFVAMFASDPVTLKFSSVSCVMSNYGRRKFYESGGMIVGLNLAPRLQLCTGCTGLGVRRPGLQWTNVDWRVFDGPIRTFQVVQNVLPGNFAGGWFSLWRSMFDSQHKVLEAQLETFEHAEFSSSQ